MRYPATVFRRVARNFPDARQGADLAFLERPAAGVGHEQFERVHGGRVPGHRGRQPSVGGRRPTRQAIATPEDLAGYLATVENGQSFGALTGDRGVGTFGGSEDHTAMLCCRAGELSQYSFCPVRHERQVPFPPAIGSSWR